MKKKKEKVKRENQKISSSYFIQMKKKIEIIFNHLEIPNRCRYQGQFRRRVPNRNKKHHYFFQDKKFNFNNDDDDNKC